MHEIRGGMCCFAAERHGRWGWGEGEVWGKRGGAKRRDKPAKQKSREKEPGEKLLVSGKNGPRGEDSIIIDVFLSPTSPVISKITHAYNTIKELFYTQVEMRQHFFSMYGTRTQEAEEVMR